MSRHEGGCLCGSLRYETTSDPVRVTICHCRFCQRATGGAYMVEPIFRSEDLRVTTGTPTVFDATSAGSGKQVHIHFCPRCGTKLYLSFERFPGMVGIYAGTFDDPGWFEVGPDNARHIFVGAARHDTILPGGMDIFVEHAIDLQGQPREGRRFDTPVAASDRPA